ncbi:MAG: hypothetical protein M3174_05070 [Actinomycetota bacterium]|nr:hypothetical protein [Actinomycetota bacterium]
MRRRKPNRAVGLLVALAALGSVACGTTDAAPQRAASGIATSAEMRTFLEDARSAANDFGRRHLGHFLKLDEKALRKNGLEIPPGAGLVVRTDHTGYCIEASSSQIPAEDEWSAASVVSGFEGISSEDRCRL